MSCSAPITSAPSICPRRRREQLAETLAPVGPQGPPTRAAPPDLWRSLRSARGSLLWTTRGRAASVSTRPLCPRTPVHHLSGLYTMRARGCIDPAMKTSLRHRGRGGSQPLDAMGRAAKDGTFVALQPNRWSAPCRKLDDSSRSLTALEQDSTIIAVIEMSQSSWLVAGVCSRRRAPASEEARADEAALLQAVASLARRSRPGRAPDQAHRRRL